VCVRAREDTRRCARRLACPSEAIRRRRERRRRRATSFRTELQVARSRRASPAGGPCPELAG
jgi:hypothetical protein